MLRHATKLFAPLAAVIVLTAFLIGCTGSGSATTPPATLTNGVTPISNPPVSNLDVASSTFFNTGTGQLTGQVPQIVVSGSSTVKVSPDRATVRFEVRSTDESAATARDTAVRSKDSLVEVLQDTPIDEDDITSSFSIYGPNRTWNPATQMYDDPVFTASFVVTAVLRDIDKLGQLLDNAIDNTANTGITSSISYGSSQADSLLNMARQGAVSDARDKATLYARELGVTLGNPLSLIETGISEPTPRFAESFALSAVAADSGGISVEPGDISFTASIQLSFEINYPNN